MNPHLQGWTVKPKPQTIGIKRQVPKGDLDKLKALWERTDKDLQPFRYPDQDNFKNEELQLGKGMWSNDLVKRVLSLNKNLIIEDSKAVPGNAAFYEIRRGEKCYTNAYFTKGFLAEFAMMKTDTADLPVKLIPGWRMVLMRLVKFGALSYSQVVRVFGEVTHNDSRGKHWAMNVSEFR